MGKSPKDPNVFKRSTGIKCVGGRCRGVIMHERTREVVTGRGPTSYGKKYPMQYVDSYFCSDGCGLLYGKPKKYKPPEITHWDPQMAEFEQELKKLREG